MFRRASLRLNRPFSNLHRSFPSRRLQSTSPPKPETASPKSRLERINSRLPRFLHRYTTPLAEAPISHITAFVLLHEITAVIPLLGLAGAFHYYNWLPPYVAEGALVKAGVEKFGRYFRRKGWISGAEEEEAEREAGIGKRGDRGWRTKWWGRGEGGVRLVVEFATAYAVVKALLPVRLLLSVWATPWFARWSVLPITRRFKQLLWRRKGKKTNEGGNAGATGGKAPVDAEMAASKVVDNAMKGKT